MLIVDKLKYINLLRIIKNQDKYNMDINKVNKKKI